MSHQLYASFLIRIWRENEEDEQEDDWHGEIESVQTGRKWRIDHLNDILQFIQAQMKANASDFSEAA